MVATFIFCPNFPPIVFFQASHHPPIYLLFLAEVVSSEVVSSE